MMEFLESQSPYLADGFFWIRGYSDYHPELGRQPARARPLGAGRSTGACSATSSPFLHPGVKRHAAAARRLDHLDRPARPARACAGAGSGTRRSSASSAGGSLRARVLGERIGVSGQALVTRLRLATRENGDPALARDADARAAHRRRRPRDRRRGGARRQGRSGSGRGAA